MNSRKRQSGFVIEGLAIVAVAIAVGLFGAWQQTEINRSVDHQFQQQQINNIKADGVNDGRVDW